MKRKLFLVSMGVIFVTQLMHSNNAKASISKNALSESDKYTEITSEEKVIKEKLTKINEYFTYNPKNNLDGMGGEHTDFEKIIYNTSSNSVLELSMTTNPVGGKRGAMVGYSEMYSSHFTDRDKRAIRRDHVKEAQSLVENYKDTQTAHDRVKAKQKVDTLSKPHQKYFNKQIDKVYNGLQR
ncbi:hypothetical protein HU219_11615 [Staphylococcus sp. SS35]|nr:hypothetical protein [Staphylococcus singaporensis]